ncbi:class I SAM-dependent methyltransferase [Acinetobacter oleivorans]|uniref:class I SAM-dependent methyltransferase n=1 Tax=Acinetobacter oleivorans TaxID=1148157 RepID=UPI003A8B4AC1
MKPFNIDERWVYENVIYWTDEILINLSYLNYFYKKETGMILDIGGGYAPFSKITNLTNYTYILVDPNNYKLNLAPNNIIKINGYAENIPVDNESVDIILTSSCLQYIDQNVFFFECQRILKEGGIIAIHENGPYNPLIIIARIIQRFIGLFNKQHWEYRNTILEYYKFREIEGFEILRYSQTGFITPIFLYMQILSFKYPKSLFNFITSIDNYLLKKIPFLKKMTFLNSVIYRKI